MIDYNHTVRSFVAALLLCSLASAATPAEVAEAKTLFGAGAAAYDKGRYAEAAAQFEEAYKLVPKPGVLFSLAQSEKKTYYANGRDQAVLRRAIGHYEQYLKEVASGGRREDATNAIAELTPQLKQGSDTGPAAAAVDTGKTRLTVDSPAEGASVSVDGAPAVEAPFVGEVSAGKHRIRVTAAGYVDAMKDITAEGRRTTLEVPLQEKPGTLELSCNRSADVYIDGQPAGRASALSRIEVSPGEHMLALSSNGSPLYSEPIRVARGKVLKQNVVLRDTTQRTLSYVTLITGGVLVLGGTISGLNALGKQNEAQDVLARRGTTLDSEGLGEYQDRVSERDSARSTSYALLGIGGAVLLVGGGLFLLDKPSPAISSVPRKEAPPPSRRFDMDAKNTRVHLLPWATPAGGGAAVLGTF